MSFELNEILGDWVRKFYNNMDIVSAEMFKTYVRGKWIIVNPSELGEFLDIPVPDEYDYPIPHDSQEPVNYDIVGTTICGQVIHWPRRLLPHGNLTGDYRFIKDLELMPVKVKKQLNRKNRFNAFDERFNLIEEAIAAILARLGHQLSMLMSYDYVSFDLFGTHFAVAFLV
ncbi:hypothetical protein MRB53_012911 [Persea americana]|uniref:Uncharacterized protein n=1 Tax=Persea americana TaxID=3435 RepID=A0ACC2LZ82_PERAE|nr:hypothetical protein MRB53_012911 [Persea americana]